MGLPEHFAQLGSPQTNNLATPLQASIAPTIGRALVLYDPAMLTIPDKREYHTIGHQYIYGIFPLTRLYFEHSGDTLLRELLVESLQSKGYEVIESPLPELDSAAALLQPQIILRPTLKELRINAYDALLFRIPSVSADLNLDFLEPAKDGFSVYESARPHISETGTSRSGLAPELLALTQKQLRLKLDRFVQPRRALTTRDFLTTVTTSRSSVLTDESRGPVTVIRPPSISFPPPPSLGKLFAASYSFDDLPSFDLGSLARISQRAITSSALGLNVSAVASSESKSDFVGGTAYWELRSDIFALAISDRSLSLGIRFNLFEGAAGSSKQSLAAHKTCTITELPLENSDGYYIATLERATALLTESFLSSQSPSARSPGNPGTNAPQAVCLDQLALTSEWKSNEP